LSQLKSEKINIENSEELENTSKLLSELRKISNNLLKLQKTIRVQKDKLSKLKNTKKVEIKILDASHNFRYSKLKKLMQDNDG